MQTDYPPVPGGGSWSWDEAAKAWKPVTPEEANAAIDKAAGLDPSPAETPIPKPRIPTKGDK